MSLASPENQELIARADDTIMSSTEAMAAFAGHPDADVTVAVGTTLLDIHTMSYDSARDRIVLRVLPEDLADAVATIARDGLTVRSAAHRR